MQEQIMGPHGRPGTLWGQGQSLTGKPPLYERERASLCLPRPCVWLAPLPTAPSFPPPENVFTFYFLITVYIQCCFVLVQVYSILVR